MIWNDRRVAIGCWLAAGLPILGTFLQATLALFGVDAFSIPVIGELKTFIDTIEVFDVAGDVFRDNDIVVFVLFILVALSWLGVGAGMFGFQHRQATYAAAGLVTVFLVLFFLVYLPLFRSDISTPQLLGFVSIPLLTVGAVWTGVISYEWTATLEAETTELLRETKEAAVQARHKFDKRVEQEADQTTLDLLSGVAPAAVAVFEEETEAFRTDCEEIEQEVAEFLKGDVPTQNRHRQAAQLHESAMGLSPIDRTNDATETLRQQLRQEIQTEFGKIRPSSPYDESYVVRNMGRYNELELDEGGPPVQIGGNAHELDKRLVEMIDTGRPLPEVAQSADRASRHLEDLIGEIRRAETKFIDRIDEIDATLSEASNALSRIDPGVAERLDEILFEKRFGDEKPPFPTEIDVRDQIVKAKSALHACRFDRAQRTASDALDDAHQVKKIAVFFSDSVIPTIKHGEGSIPIPPDVGSEVVEKMGIEIRQTYDTEYTIANGTLSIDSGGETTPVESEQRTAGQSSRSGEKRPEDVLYLLRELQTQASDSNARGTATIQLGEYPEKFSDEEVVQELEAFCSRQSSISEVEMPDTEPGYIKIVAAEDESIRSVLTTVYDQYHEQY